MKVRYVKLPTNAIFNWLDPFHVTAKWACKAITGDWWSERNVAIRRYFADTWTVEYDRITRHFTDLEESIREKGILTPISCDSGPPRKNYLKPFHFPPEQQHDLSRAVHTRNFGGSRVTIAVKLDIKEIPVIVHDYANIFPNEPEVTPQNYKQWFGDEYVWATVPPHLRIRYSSHMKNKKYSSMNKSTRQAHEQASNVARTKTYAKFGLVGDT